MRTLFNPDNPFMQMLVKIGDMIIANFLFLLCSLPVVTIGASAAALNKVMQGIALGEDKYVVRPFFRAFAQNFRQATIAWLWIALFIAALLCYWLIIMAYCVGALRTALNALLFAIAILVLCVAVYLFALMVRYENTLREHLRNAMILAVVKLPKTVLMAALQVLPLIIAYLSGAVFVQTLIFWVFIGFGFISYAQSGLLRRVFRELEKSHGEAPDVSLFR